MDTQWNVILLLAWMWRQQVWVVLSLGPFLRYLYRTH